MIRKRRFSSSITFTLKQMNKVVHACTCARVHARMNYTEMKCKTSHCVQVLNSHTPSKTLTWSSHLHGCTSSLKFQGFFSVSDEAGTNDSNIMFEQLLTSAAGLHCKGLVTQICAINPSAVTKGNKAEMTAPLILSLVLALPLLAMYAYFIDFQTYV